MASDSASTVPIFDNKKVTVIFVVGAGADFYFCDLSARNLLRADQTREGSQYGNLIRICIKAGTIVPMHVTIKLLENAMTEEISKGSGEGWQDGRARFLIDGFPRKMDQALELDDTGRSNGEMSPRASKDEWT